MVDPYAIVRRLTGHELISPKDARLLTEAVDGLIDEIGSKDARIAKLAAENERLREQITKATDPTYLEEKLRQIGVTDEMATEALSAAARVRAEDNAEGGEPVVESIESYYRRQIEWSRNTFGPGTRTKGIIDHIRKELAEIEAEPDDLSEWVDVIILAMDGFWRHGGSADDLMSRLLEKQRKNFARKWPDWRTMSPDKAIEHDRSCDARPAPQPSGTVHPDDLAVDRFAAAMKAKLKWEREERGRHGWNDPSICPESYLARLLIEHLAKGNDGNFEDVANLCMMLHQRGAHPRVLADALTAGKPEQVPSGRPETVDSVLLDAVRKIASTDLSGCADMTTAEIFGALSRMHETARIAVETAERILGRDEGR